MRGLAAIVAVSLGAAAAAAVPPFGLGTSDPRAPIEITAEKLEAREREGVRILAFEQGVVVHQAELTLRAQHLEARYPRGERQPERLRAWGRVEIREGERRARCDEASYERPAQRIVCRGQPAQLQDGEDRLSGREVVFHLADRRVVVDGEAKVELHRGLAADEETPPSAAAGSEGNPPRRDPLERLEGGGPVTIAARKLEARDRDGQRDIHFRGDVRARQQDFTLRADALKAVYPRVGGEPDRLFARGDVVIAEGEREARCERADYRPRAQRVTCEGGARLRDGRDELSGQRIAFDFGAQRIRVIGETRLRVEAEPRP